VPIVSFVEFRVAVPAEYAPDLLYFIGLTNSAMVEERPKELPSPPRIDFLDLARRLYDISATLSQYLPGVEPRGDLPRDRPISEVVRESLELGEEILGRINLMHRSLSELSARLNQVRLEHQIASLVERLGIPRLENLGADLILADPRAMSELVKASELYQLAVLQLGVVEGRELAYVIYPLDLETEVRKLYQVLNVNIARPRRLDEVEAELKELEVKVERLRESISSSLEAHRETIERLVKVSRAAARIAQGYSEGAIPEGREVEERVREIRKAKEEISLELKRVEKILKFLKALSEIGVRSLRLPDTAVVVLDAERPSDRYPYHVEEVGGIVAYTIFCYSREEVERAVEDFGGVVVPREYLEDVEFYKTMLENRARELEARLRLNDRLLAKLLDVYKEYSAYGDERWSERPNAVSILLYVREKDVGTIDDALSKFIEATGVRVEVVRRLRVKFVREVEPERSPTLEIYPKPVDVFKRIVYMYGVPKVLEVSPVPLTAVLFPLFFGFMYGDLGHGALLVITGILLMGRGIPLGRVRLKNPEWGHILAITGVFSMIFGGFIYGEAFGIRVYEGLMPIVREHGLDPTSIATLLSLSILIGIVSLLLSFATKVVNEALHDARIALAQTLPIALFFTSLTLIFVSAGVLPMMGMLEFVGIAVRGLADLFTYLAIASIIWIAVGTMYLRKILSKVEEAPPIVDEAIVGVVEAFLGSIANTISFGRLAVMALSHAVMVHLLNTMSAPLGAAGFAVAIPGHALIALGEGLFSFIQGLRLHYYEMFSKFFSGEGREFAPFRLA